MSRVKSRWSSGRRRISLEIDGGWRMQNGEGTSPKRVFTKAGRRYLGRVINGMLED